MAPDLSDKNPSMKAFWAALAPFLIALIAVATALLAAVGYQSGTDTTTTTVAPTTTTTTTTTAASTTTTAAPATTTTVAAPAAGAFPGAATTGVPTPVRLTASGPVTVTTNGTVIDGLDVTGCIDVRASNVVIKNTRVRFAGGCGNEVVRIASGTNLVVQDSELDGQKRSDCGESIGYANYTALRVNMHGCSDGPRVANTATVTVRDSWVHDLSNLPGDHGDGIQCYGGQGSMTIVHNTIEGGSNAAFMTADGCSGVLLLDGNLFSGGSYTVRLYDNQATVTNNVWVKNTWGYGPVATFSKAGAADPGVTIVAWSNNRIASNADGTGLADTIARP